MIIGEGLLNLLSNISGNSPEQEYMRLEEQERKFKNEKSNS